jgi:predicted enzyme related to lactoylglutathione lyase
LARLRHEERTTFDVSIGARRVRQAESSEEESFMSQGIKQFNYPVEDLARAKALYSKLLGVEPYVDEPYYVGFRVGKQEIGLDPNGHKLGMTGPAGFFEVSDIAQSLQALLDVGAQIQQEARDVGGGKLVAYVKDADGNSIGLIQSP